MRRYAIALVVLMLCGFVSMAQRVENWSGELNAGIQKLPITLTLQIGNDTVAEMGSPSQTEKMFKANKVVLRNDSMMFSVKLGLSKVVFKGKYLGEDSVCGIFKQNGAELPLCLKRGKNKMVINRPQTPKDINYVCEEWSFRVKDVDYEFKGTLTYPKKGKNFPCVILVSGSGLQDRNEEIMQHKPFEVIADYLTRNGIAVFRYDDRGWGTQDMELVNGTTLNFADDAEAAFQLLKSHKKIDPKRIGFAGHSEGGVIAPIVASRNKDVAFVIMLAGTGVDGESVLIEQDKAILGKMGASQEEIQAQINSLKNRDNNPALQVPWFKCFLDLDPRDYLSKLNMPVLALNGDKDVQVIASQNLPEIEKALKKAGNKKYKTVLLPNLNHLFQECETGLPDEYFSIEQTISPKVLELMRDFIDEYVR